MDEITIKSLLWCSFRCNHRLNRCPGALLTSTRGGSKTSLFSINGGPLLNIFSTFPPLTPHHMQGKVAANHRCPHTPKKSQLERPRPGLFPPRWLQRKLLYGLAAGKGCLGSRLTAGILKGLQKRGLICYSVPGQGQWSRRGGGGG